jgi:hypothetical protein
VSEGTDESKMLFNAYSYTRNNPLAFVDPSGFQGVPASGCPRGSPRMS